MKLIVEKEFSWAHRGCIVEHFERGAVIETENTDLIGVSLQEGWTRDSEAEAKARAEAEAKAREETEAKAKASGKSGAK